MIIKKPYLEEENNKVYIKYEYILKNGINNILWFELESRYKKYLTLENSDAGLVCLLLLAMNNNEDIKIEGKISEKLYYGIKTYIIPALNLANNNWNKINIFVDSLNNSKLLKTEGKNGTGLSCGIDSLSTIYTHEELEDEYKVNYFTFLNAGSHGDFGGDKSRKIFNERYELIKNYPTNKEIIKIDTNLNDILLMNHQLTHTLRSIGCILNLQNLFKNYYYASTYRFENYKLKNSIDTGNYDILILPLLSTETTTFYSSVSQFTRVERTEKVSMYKESFKTLNVCVNTSQTEEIENCSICSKCLRTEICLDLLGKLELYKEVFDIKKYKKVKNKYIGYILFSKNENIFSNEIYELLKEKKYKLSIKHHIYKCGYIGYNLLRKIKHKIIGNN